jgi:alpha-N-arabinofuranosidase
MKLIIPVFAVLYFVSCSNGPETEGRILGPCNITINHAEYSHTVSPLLFGDQNEWTNRGNDLFPAGTLVPDSARLALIKETGVTLVRYPGGTVSDFFHWGEAVGELSSRKPQINPYESEEDNLQTELPLYGPDEFAGLCRYLDAEMLVTVNVGTGTAEEAAAWLQYYIDKGIDVRYWEIGNEVYYDSAGGEYAFSEVYMEPLEYAVLFDDYAAALRAVDPDIKIGILGVDKYSLVPQCPYDNWNEIVLDNITEKADFMAVHNCYAPISLHYDPDDDRVYQALLAAPEFSRMSFNRIISDIQCYGTSDTRPEWIAVTEHASFFVNGDASLDLQIKQMERNRSLGSALFSALIFNLFISQPDIQMAAHINMNSPWWQAAVQLETENDFTCLPFRSAYFHVFRLYREAAGGTVVSVDIEDCPVYSAPASDNFPALADVPCLDALGVFRPDENRLYLYVVNRDIHDSIEARINFANPAVSVTAETLTAGSCADFNTGNSPDRIIPETRILTAANPLTYIFGPCSLTRVTIQW